jgi:hypothetical protein
MANRAGRRSTIGLLLLSSVFLLAACGSDSSPDVSAGNPDSGNAGGAGDARGLIDIAPGEPTPVPTSCVPEPLDESGNGVRVKSPASQMRFTAGLPFRILADSADPDAWMCPPGHPPYVCPGTEMRFYVDGTLVGIQPPNPQEEDHFEWRMPEGLPRGDHALTVSYVQYDPKADGGGPVVASPTAVTIAMDDLPVHAGTITLTADLVLQGSTALDWNDQTIVGNGHKVTSASGYSGNVHIQNSMITGLADYESLGIEIVTTGNVLIQDSVFEATGAVSLTIHGSADATLTDNEFRSNNFVTYVASDPSRSPVLTLSGDTTGAKKVQGNRFGGGIVSFYRSDGWQIGGLAAGEGNILIGPRAVLSFDSSSKNVIQGNYDLHDYHGGWSQGFNLASGGGSDQQLAEHNVIRSGSWPVQSFGGEFRYNLVVDSGHDWWRSAMNDTKIHHNLFVHTTGPDGSFNGGIMVYSGESGLVIDNNTFDGGGDVGKFGASPIVIGDGSVFASIRNDVFTGFSDVGDTFDKAFIKGPPGGLSYADYNDFYNPLATKTSSYDTGLAANAGAHDLKSDPHFAGQPEIPYRISAGCIWSRTYTTAQVLAHYREVYRPGPGSQLVDAGDPADGTGVDIGAIGEGTTDPADLFGLGIRE